MLLMGRTPTISSRSRSQAGEGPSRTSSTRAEKRGHRSAASISTRSASDAGVPVSANDSSRGRRGRE